MKYQEKFTIPLSKLKVHRANSQTISSYPVRFFTDILFSSLVSFAFCVLACLFFFWLKIYGLIHIWLCGRVSDKTIFSWPISGNKTTFFWPYCITRLIVVYTVGTKQYSSCVSPPISWERISFNINWYVLF